ncbi:MAG: gamma-glutamylcyclotransferase [Candidatus Thermoplasmatota archaeon]|nr:gamma-glutamylcyclotransferase [Candidatus Thermoplasmatota archaeon]
MDEEVEYFAYGSNLNPDQMEERGIKVVGTKNANLPGWRLAFTIYSESWEGGVADIIPRPGKKVEGVVYTIDEESLENLDRYEGRQVLNDMERGMYRRQYIPVKVNEKWKTVLTYVVNRTVEHKRQVDLKPSREYLNTIILGARKHGLTEGYIKRLKEIEENL